MNDKNEKLENEIEGLLIRMKDVEYQNDKLIVILERMADIVAKLDGSSPSNTFYRAELRRPSK